jgi:hypothetical protein
MDEFKVFESSLSQSVQNILLNPSIPLVPKSEFLEIGKFNWVKFNKECMHVIIIEYNYFFALTLSGPNEMIESYPLPLLYSICNECHDYISIIDIECLKDHLFYLENNDKEVSEILVEFNYSKKNFHMEIILAIFLVAAKKFNMEIIPAEYYLKIWNFFCCI